MGDVEDLDARKARKRTGEVALEGVEAEIQDLDVWEEPEALWDAAGELVVEEEQLPYTGPCVAETSRDGAREPVVGQADDGGRRAPQAHGDLSLEVVVVEEDGVEVHREELVGNLPRETVESEVEVDQARHVQNRSWERPREVVVAEIDLCEGLETPERVRDRPREPVAVKVKDGEIG